MSFECTVPLRVFVRGYCIGVKKRKDPKRDRRLYLVVDDFTVDTGFDEKKGLTVSVCIKKHHIERLKVSYCIMCLKEGKRVHAVHMSQKGDWCKDHYAEKVRRESPDRACPMCDVGYIMSGMGCNLCSHCNYSEPHVHDRPSPLPAVPYPIPSSNATVVLDTSVIPMAWACDCMTWDTPEQHRLRRERIKRERAEKEAKIR